MTVSRMMREMDSLEFAQWLAYERVYGPVGTQWQDEALADIQEELQLIAHLLGQAHFTGKHKKKGPVPKPERYPRPHEPLLQARPQQDEDDNEEEWALPPDVEGVDGLAPDSDE